MSEEIYINNGTSFQQPYIARNTVNAQTPVIGQTPSQQPTVGRSPFTYQERAPSTYRNPVNYRIPYIANSTGTTPVIANAQSPYIANAQQPARAAVGYRVPFTYQSRQPATYRHTGRTPFTYQARQPSTYQAQGQTPFPYIAQGRTSARYPASAQQPYPYIANAQNPYPYIANYQSPARAIARTPTTYQHQQPVIGRVPYIYAQETDYVDEVFVDAQNQDYLAGGEISFYMAHTGPAKAGFEVIASTGMIEAYSANYEVVALYLGSSTVYSNDGGTVTGSWPSNNRFWYVEHPGATSGLNYTTRYAISNTSGYVPNYTTYGSANRWTTTAQTFGHNDATGRRRFRAFQFATNDSYTSVFTFTATNSLSSYPTYTWVCDCEIQVDSEETDCPECCIVDNELIATTEGEKHVNDITRGDFVLGYNWRTNQIEKTRVSHVRRVRRGGIIKVNDLRMTDDHPIYLADGRLASYNPAGTEANYKKICVQLSVGDEILDIHGNKVTVNKIETITGEMDVYTIKTHLDNFYASGILVDSALRAKPSYARINDAEWDVTNVRKYFI